MLLILLLALAVPCVSAQLLIPRDDDLYLGSPCTTPEGTSGTCTILEKCTNSFDKVKSKQIPLHSLRICCFDKKNAIVCCENSEPREGNQSVEGKTTPNSKDIEQETTEATSTESESDAWIIIALLKTPHLSPEEINSVKGLDEALESNGIKSNITKPGDARRPAEIACDQHTKKALKAINPHIILGIPAKPGEFPHMAAMAFSTVGGHNFEFSCGASLISDNYALTAAHCVNRPELHPLFLRLGKVSLTTDVDDELEATDVGVDEVIRHPEYKGSLVYHDIALLKLNQSVKFSPYVRPVCLYTKSAPFTNDTVLTVTGWGKTTFVGGSFNDVLLKANLTQVDQNECNQTYMQNGKLGRQMRFGVRSEGQLCAFGNKDEDACQGDSGGPLQIVQEEGSSIQVGVVSIGIGCGLVPGIYTKVADYLDWIESVVWP